MIKIFQRYVGWTYFKNVFVIFIGLVFFYAGVDYITNLKDLPESANLQLLYVSLNALTAINYALPLAIVFAMVVTKFGMIRSNELICFYAAGISKSRLLLPLFLIAMVLTLIYISLNLTPFAYAYEYRTNLLKNNRLAPISQELFLKYGKSYVYISELDLLLQEARDITIFDVENSQLIQTVEAKKAFFRNDKWELYEGRIVTKPKVQSLDDSGIKIETFEKMDALEGFKPKIIENTHQGDVALSILDALDTLEFFNSQSLDITPIKAKLYSMILFPLFAPFMVVILYYYLPASGRFFNLALLSFVFVFITLCVWGILFVLTQLSQAGVILPEIGIAAPIFLMGFFSLWLYYKNR
jgi:lipopolysaccharide export system permease protein